MFDDFWKAYPRKVGKPAAQRAFKAAARKAEIAEIAEGLHRWRGFWDSDQTEERHIPHPSTWLNQERWNDSPPATKARPMDLISALAAGEFNDPLRRDNIIEGIAR